MKLATGLGLGVLLAGICAAAPGEAQGIPQGPYLQTCTGATVEGPNLIARCRRADGFEERSALADFDRCGGDIINEDGVLRCAGGHPPGGVVVVPTPPGAIQTADRCIALRREADELHDRLDQAIDPTEHARLEGRLHEVHLQQEHCP